MTTAYRALADVPNACQVLPGMVTGGQPSATDLQQFAEAGGGIVLDIRDPMEPRSFDEAAAARRLGLDYRNIPVTGGTLTDETLDRIRTILREAGDRTVFVHCASGNRVGGALLPHFILDLGLEEESAMGEAMRVGLRSAELMEWGTDYARRKLAE